MKAPHEVVKAFMMRRGYGGTTKEDYGLRQLSRKSGVPVTTLANFFNRPHYLNLENKKKICKTLKIDSAEKLNLLEGIIRGKLPKEMYADLIEDFQSQIDNIKLTEDAD